MLKKIMLSAVVLCSALSLAAAPKVRVDQSSPRSVCITLIKAIAYDDADAFWELVAQDERDMLRQEVGDKNEAFQFLKKNSGFNDRNKQRELVKNIRNQEFLNEFANYLLENGFEFKRIGSKWYLNLTAMGKAAEAAEAADIHASKEAVIEAMLQAVCDEDEKLFWETLAPSLRKQAVAEFGSEEKAQKELLKIFYNRLGKNLSKLKELFKDKDSKEGLIKIQVETLNKALVNIDGKWYVDFSKL